MVIHNGNKYGTLLECFCGKKSFWKWSCNPKLLSTTQSVTHIVSNHWPLRISDRWVQLLEIQFIGFPLDFDPSTITPFLDVAHISLNQNPWSGSTLKNEVWYWISNILLYNKVFFYCYIWFHEEPKTYMDLSISQKFLHSRKDSSYY